MIMNLCQSRSDLELAWASANGDEAAFQCLYGRHRGWVYSFCLRILGNVADAERLTREVFINAYRRAHTMNEDVSFTQWLHRLTVNALLKHLKQKNGRSAAEREGTAPSLDTGPPLVGRVSPIDRGALEAVIGQLPAEDRIAFVLHDVDGFDDEEIANMLGVSTETFRSQLHRARLKVRRYTLDGASGSKVRKSSQCGIWN
ncbi:MAG: RNA polymerase sigma factor [Acidobacteria bacterium]|nr:RNA polymerase sigma factor [Acidobacteriota bacterium]